MATKLDRIIEDMEFIRSRPGMFMRVGVSDAEAFWDGFINGLCACGVQWDWDTMHQVEAARGWTPEPVGPVPEMERRGMTVHQIMSELLDIRIDTLRHCNAAASPAAAKKQRTIKRSAKQATRQRRVRRLQAVRAGRADPCQG